MELALALDRVSRYIAEQCGNLLRWATKHVVLVNCTVADGLMDTSVSIERCTIAPLTLAANSKHVVDARARTV